MFGYGSLIWKPPPHYDRRISGYIEGYVRRFWQASGDHRGTPESPGRVVTVIEKSFWKTLNDPQVNFEQESTVKVWGAAYHIPAPHAEEVHDYLDDREIDGYTVHYTPFYPNSAVPTSTGLPSSKEGSLDTSYTYTPPIICMVYIGQPSNPQFLRDPARRDPQDIAQVISVSRGLSGKNAEYLFLLDKALEGLGLGSADVHVTDLVRRVRALEHERFPVEEEEAERELCKSLHRSPAEAHKHFPRTE